MKESKKISIGRLTPILRWSLRFVILAVVSTYLAAQSPTRATRPDGSLPSSAILSAPAACAPSYPQGPPMSGTRVLFFTTSSQVPGAQVYLDGKCQGMVRQEAPGRSVYSLMVVNVPTGEHAVVIRRPGNADYQTQIKVLASNQPPEQTPKVIVEFQLLASTDSVGKQNTTVLPIPQSAHTAPAISQISLTQRQQGGLPDSTAVTVGKKTATLGQLRAAHLVREQSRKEAVANGAGVKQFFANAQNSAPTGTSSHSSSGTTGVKGERVGPEEIKPGPQPPVVNLPSHTPTVSLPNLGATLAAIGILEPPADYKNTQIDMEAFCSNAWASACLYIPPGQTFLDSRIHQTTTTSPAFPIIYDADRLVDENTCGKEGGLWGPPDGCIFNYPASYQAHFTPFAPFVGTTSAQCDQTIWTYTVDFHAGLITVQLRPELMPQPNQDDPGLYDPGKDFTSGATPWCVIHVYPQRTPQ